MTDVSTRAAERISAPDVHTELARVVVGHGQFDHAEAPQAWRWDRFEQPNDLTVLVLSRPKLIHEGEIALDHDGNPYDDTSTGGVFSYPGASTLAEAQGAHAAWCAWRTADVASHARKPTVTRADADRLHAVHHRIVGNLPARTTAASPRGHAQ